MKNNSFSEKVLLGSLIKERFTLNDRETRQMVQNILDVHDGIISGSKDESIMKDIQKFLDDFANDLSAVEKRHRTKRKSESARKKKKSQLDFFPAQEKTQTHR